MKVIKGKTKVAIIGAGVVGSAVGYILKNKGYKIAGIASRRLESAKRRLHLSEMERHLRIRYLLQKAQI